MPNRRPKREWIPCGAVYHKMGPQFSAVAVLSAVPVPDRALPGSAVGLVAAAHSGAAAQQARAARGPALSVANGNCRADYRGPLVGWPPSTATSAIRSSPLTRRWRELDSNHRFLSKPEVFLPQ